jgi:pyrimidine operon attenuation protein/uracil phosphoribosyltransferase
MDEMKILDQVQIKQKIKRLAYEISESNYNETTLVFAGINNNGLGFAKMLKKQLEKISDINIELKQIRLNPAAPTEHPIGIDVDQAELKGKTIVVIDDVANTGRTMFYAMRVFMEVLPKRVETAVLIDRKHKLFPIEINYFGLSLATTMKEDIQVFLEKTSEMAVHIR